VVQYYVGRYTETALAPRGGEREVNMRRQYVGELVKGERGLVRDNAHLLGPKPRGDQLFVLDRWEMNEPVDATP
jgi:hypothetical protein